MADFWTLQRHSIEECDAMARLKRAGLTDADIQGLADTNAALLAAVKTRRDAATTPPTMRPAFDIGLFALQQMQADGLLVDGATKISNLLTVAATPFVAAVATDLTSIAATNAPNPLGTFDPLAGQVLIPTAFGARGF